MMIAKCIEESALSAEMMADMKKGGKKERGTEGYERKIHVVSTCCVLVWCEKEQKSDGIVMEVN